MKLRNLILRVFLAAVGLCAGLWQANAQTTAFSYQGQLNDNGAPANGFYDLQFTAYDALTGGNPVGAPVTVSSVLVNNGLFSVQVDLGAGVFTGGDRWLELSVSPAGAADFGTLTPRQVVTPTPYALFAPTAGTAQNVGTSSVSAGQLNTLVAPTAGEVLAFDGGNLFWTTPASTGSGWSLAGNVVAAGQFLGSLNNAPLEFQAGGVRAFRLEPDVAGSGAPNVIGGSAANFAGAGVVGATIGGGGAVNYSGAGYSNSVTAIFGTVGGGVRNNAGGAQAVVGGGFQNTASGYISTVVGGAYNIANTNEAFVGGGAFNLASGFGSAVVGGGTDGNTSLGNGAAGQASFIGGGLGNDTTFNGYISAIVGGSENTASGSYGFIGAGVGNTASGDNVVREGTGLNQLLYRGSSTVAGGFENTASSTAATVPGGAFNIAAGTFSFAAGYHASALNTGSFVWADSSSPTAFSSSASDQFLIRSHGGVGIGTSQTPPGGLRVASGGLAVTGGSSPNYPGSSGVFIEKAGGAGAMFAYDYNTPGPLPLALNSPGGNVGIGTLSPQYTLDVAGVTRTHSIIITGGSDLAEPFKMGGTPLPKGSVVVIDPEHPGELKLSASAYDTRVAGIVSGANGINPGIALHQEGALDGDQNVALSGRVYVLADARSGAINPGDLLTTSSIPGHAMKVADHARASGAILGKAMSSLSEGRGMVLVLVTLQ